jgi:ureidoacrylate peracid hydrolase
MSTALVVVDLQNAFCQPEGSFAQRGVRIEGVERVVDGCLRLIAHAEAADWSVVYTTLVFRCDYRDAGQLVARNPAIRELGGYCEGSWDAALVDALLPVSGSAFVVRKSRYDPFCGTGLEADLRGRGVSEVVVCGVTTNVCVESTVRRAHDLDFPVRIVTDAMASYDAELHRASLATMSRHFATPVAIADLLGSGPSAS